GRAYVVERGCGCSSVGFRKQDRKLIATQTRNEIDFTNGLLHHIGDDSEQLVACVMSKHVVDLFEAINVNVCQRDWTIVTPGAVAFYFQSFEERAPVRDPGQWVSMRPTSFACVQAPKFRNDVDEEHVNGEPGEHIPVHKTGTRGKHSTM